MKRKDYGHRFPMRPIVARDERDMSRDELIDRFRRGTPVEVARIPPYPSTPLPLDPNQTYPSVPLTQTWTYNPIGDNVTTAMWSYQMESMSRSGEAA